ncbi:MAG: imidazole glycerol phosphate synthase subunit HisF [Candidatus Riflebacteria bacterium]|nr:imidazole glycerol phosphate synthase subunit HisF [Candidatus Riflebacteria bacterium]
MLRKRVIPCLLLSGRGLVKTVRFADPRYVGDPINAVRIFNEKRVDEIVFLDITASRERRPPDFDHLRQISSECFIPFCYGGGVRTVQHARQLFSIGVEKVAINTAALDDYALISSLASECGTQSVVGAMDVLTRGSGYEVIRATGLEPAGIDPVCHAQRLEAAGAGEIFVNSVDRDGTMQGYDVELLKLVTSAVTVPVIACGGAGSLVHLKQAIDGAGVSAVAAGSLFVFKGKHRAVLINYPAVGDLRALWGQG